MSAEILARWQFGITTVYHYFFVPMTIALSMLVAILQTMWVKTRKEKFLRLTKFYGKLFLINFAMGVVTGIVQEFQFGMNWSEYSRFVGDIFGAPLALEALLAFFLESTFLGLWIFGWDRLSKKVHLATIWLASIGTLISSIFILAANSWMQNPVGAKFNPETKRAELDNFLMIFTNPVFIATFFHTIAAAWMVATGFVAGIAGWHLARIHKQEHNPTTHKDVSGYRYAVKLGAIGLIISGLAVCISGDFQGKIMTDVQPMKMAAAEALYETSPEGKGAPFSVITIGSLDGKKELWALTVPNLLSFLATGNMTAEVKGINELNQTYSKTFASADDLQKEQSTGKVMTKLQQEYKASGEIAKMTKDRSSWTPNVPVSYWSFRLMMGLGFVAMGIGIWMLIAVGAGRLPKSNFIWNAAMIITPLLPLFGNSFGWIFTEMGRQPWIVAGVLPTFNAVSPTVTAGEVLFSTIVYTLIYGIFAVVEVGLMLKYIKLGMPDVQPVTVKTDEETPLSFAY